MNILFKNGLNNIINIISNENNNSIKFSSTTIKVLQNFIDDLLKRIILQSKKYNETILTPSSIQKSIINNIFFECPELSNIITIQCMQTITRVSTILENKNKQKNPTTTTTTTTKEENKINLNNLAGLNLSIFYTLSIIKSIDEQIKIVDLSPILLTAICDTILFELVELSTSLNEKIINTNNLILSIKKDQELSKVLNIKKDQFISEISSKELLENNDNNKNFNEFLIEDFLNDQENNQKDNFNFEIKE